MQRKAENTVQACIYTRTRSLFAQVADAIKHPNWSMGKKITVDSATLMNKGLEVIEAHYLYGTDYDNIEIVIHPQSIIHSMVETADSSVLAQLGWPDMRLPILYTLTWPERFNASEQTWPRLDFLKMGDLTFKEPDHAKYPSMQVAYGAGRAGGTMTGELIWQLTVWRLALAFSFQASTGMQ